MDLLTYYPDLAVAYPEYITQKQFCEVCGICHKTAYNLTRRGEISYEIVDTPTGRIHHIKLTDALAYLYKKDTLYGNDENVNRQIYEVLQAHFSYLPDLLRTQQIRELTGFSMTAIQRWVLEKRITAILGRKGWNIWIRSERQSTKRKRRNGSMWSAPKTPPQSSRSSRPRRLPSPMRNLRHKILFPVKRYLRSTADPSLWTA